MGNIKTGEPDQPKPWSGPVQITPEHAAELQKERETILKTSEELGPHPDINAPIEERMAYSNRFIAEVQKTIPGWGGQVPITPTPTQITETTPLLGKNYSELEWQQVQLNAATDWLQELQRAAELGGQSEYEQYREYYEQTYNPAYARYQAAREAVKGRYWKELEANLLGVGLTPGEVGSIKPDWEYILALGLSPEEFQSQWSGFMKQWEPVIAKRGVEAQLPAFDAGLVAAGYTQQQIDKINLDLRRIATTGRTYGTAGYGGVEITQEDYIGNINREIEQQNAKNLAEYATGLGVWGIQALGIEAANRRQQAEFDRQQALIAGAVSGGLVTREGETLKTVKGWEEYTSEQRSLLEGLGFQISPVPTVTPTATPKTFAELIGATRGEPVGGGKLDLGKLDLSTGVYTPPASTGSVPAAMLEKIYGGTPPGVIKPIPHSDLGSFFKQFADLAGKLGIHPWQGPVVQFSKYGEISVFGAPSGAITYEGFSRMNKAQLAGMVSGATFGLAQIPVEITTPQEAAAYQMGSLTGVTAAYPVVFKAVGFAGQAAGHAGKGAISLMAKAGTYPVEKLAEYLGPGAATSFEAGKMLLGTYATRAAGIAAAWVPAGVEMYLTLERQKAGVPAWQQAASMAFELPLMYGLSAGVMKGITTPFTFPGAQPKVRIFEPVESEAKMSFGLDKEFTILQKQLWKAGEPVSIGKLPLGAKEMPWLSYDVDFAANLDVARAPEAVWYPSGIRAPGGFWKVVYDLPGGKITDYLPSTGLAQPGGWNQLLIGNEEMVYSYTRLLTSVSDDTAFIASKTWVQDVLPGGPRSTDMWAAFKQLFTKDTGGAGGTFYKTFDPEKFYSDPLRKIVYGEEVLKSSLFTGESVQQLQTLPSMLIPTPSMPVYYTSVIAQAAGGGSILGALGALGVSGAFVSELFKPAVQPITIPGWDSMIKQFAPVSVAQTLAQVQSQQLSQTMAQMQSQQLSQIQKIEQAQKLDLTQLLRTQTVQTQRQGVSLIQQLGVTQVQQSGVIQMQQAGVIQAQQLAQTQAQQLAQMQQLDLVQRADLTTTTTHTPWFPPSDEGRLKAWDPVKRMDRSVRDLLRMWKLGDIEKMLGGKPAKFKEPKIEVGEMFKAPEMFREQKGGAGEPKIKFEAPVFKFKDPFKQRKRGRKR